MRICYVAHASFHFLPSYVNFFCGQGHEVHVVTLENGNVPNAVMHHPYRRRFDPMQNKLVYFRAWRGVRRALRRIRPDIVHAHYLTSNAVMAAIADVHPLAVTAHGSDVHESTGSRLRRAVIRFVTRRADLVNTVSDGLRDNLLGIGVPVEKIVTLTVGIDTGRFLCDRDKAREGPIRILCTRRMLPVYECGTIIRALGDLKTRGSSFVAVMAGTGPEEPALKALAAENDLADHVRFLGGYRPAELPALLADAEIYLSASRWDGTSLSLLEAMASGLFPVVSDIPANREWLSGDGDGLLFPVGDTRLMADYLQKAIDDADSRRRAVAVNRRRVSERGDRDTNLRMLGEHYQRLITASR